MTAPAAPPVPPVRMDTDALSAPQDLQMVDDQLDGVPALPPKVPPP